LVVEIRLALVFCGEIRPTLVFWWFSNGYWCFAVRSDQLFIVSCWLSRFNQPCCFAVRSDRPWRFAVGFNQSLVFSGEILPALVFCGKIQALNGIFRPALKFLANFLVIF